MIDFEDSRPPELGSQFSEKRGGTTRYFANNPMAQSQWVRSILGFAASSECLHAETVKDPELRAALQLVLARFSMRYPQYLEQEDSDDFHETSEQLTARIAKGFLDNSFK